MRCLLLFALVRVASALVVGELRPLHDGRSFGGSFTDLELYNSGGSILQHPWSLPNPLYSVVVRGLGYGQEQLQDAHYIFLSIILNVAFTAIFVVVSCKVLAPQKRILYAVALGTHPYLALYSLKLDTSTFALLPVGLLTAGALIPPEPKGTLLVSALSTLLRNALLPMVWLDAIWQRRSILRGSNMVALGILAMSSALQMGYGWGYVGQNYGCYALERVTSWLMNKGWPESVASFGGYVLTPLIHLLLDLGAREAVANYCILLPSSIAKQVWLHLGATSFFVVVHGWLLWRLLLIVVQNLSKRPVTIRLLFPLAMLVPTLYGAAHMRYLIPIIPLLMLMGFNLEGFDSLSQINENTGNSGKQRLVNGE